MGPTINPCGTSDMIVSKSLVTLLMRTHRKQVSFHLYHKLQILQLKGRVGQMKSTSPTT